MENQTAVATQTATPEQTKAFNANYSKYYQMIFAYVLRKVNNVQSAEEIVNDVFIRSWKYRFEDKKSSYTTWLHNIANSCIIDHIRMNRYGRNCVNVSEFANAETGKETFDFADSGSADESVENKELRAGLVQAFKTLKPNYRKIAILYFIQHEEYSKIAETCNVPMGTVKGMISRIREMLQSKLKHQFAI